MSLSREQKEIIKNDFAQPFFDELSSTTPGFKERCIQFQLTLGQYSKYIGKWNFDKHFKEDTNNFRRFMMLYLTPESAKLPPTAVRTYMRELIAEFMLSLMPDDSLHKLKKLVTEDEHNFYAVGEIVKTTLAKTGSFFNRRYELSADAKALRNTLQLTSQGTIFLFKNMYEALEYLAFTSPKLDLCPWLEIPDTRALWVVKFNGELNQAIVTETILLNENLSSSRRSAEINYNAVNRKEVEPIAVVALNGIGEDGIYFKTLNHTSMSEPLVEKVPEEKCLVM